MTAFLEYLLTDLWILFVFINLNVTLFLRYLHVITSIKWGNHQSYSSCKKQTVHFSSFFFRLVSRPNRKLYFNLLPQFSFLHPQFSDPGGCCFTHDTARDGLEWGKTSTRTKTITTCAWFFTKGKLWQHLILYDFLFVCFIL